MVIPLLIPYLAAIKKNTFGQIETIKMNRVRNKRAIGHKTD
jgi:hypothetical protein